MTKEWIPNLQIGQDYDSKYRDADIHFDRLGAMADFFGRDMPVHIHADFCQIHVVLTGETQFDIDQSRYQTTGTAVFYTPPATPHAFLTEADAPGYVLTVHHSIINKIASELGSQDESRFLLLPSCMAANDIKSGQQDTFDATLALIELIKFEWLAQQSHKNEMLLSLIKALLLTIFRLSQSHAKSNNSSRHEIDTYKSFNQLIEGHYKTEKSIAFYCQQLNMNESRLNYICKKVSGSPPKALINNRVILEAKRQILHTTQSLNQVSYDLGYIDPSYFSRFFQIKTGLTPSEFRNANLPGSQQDEQCH